MTETVELIEDIEGYVNKDYSTPLMPGDTVSHEGPDGRVSYYDVVQILDVPGFASTLILVRAEKTMVAHIFERHTLYLIGSDD